MRDSYKSVAEIGMDRGYDGRSFGLTCAMREASSFLTAVSFLPETGLFSAELDQAAVERFPFEEALGTDLGAAGV